LPEEIHADHEYKTNSIQKDHQAYVPDTKLDYHAQLQIVAKGLKAGQDQLKGMEICPPWLCGTFCLYNFLVPIAFLWEILQHMINYAA